MQTCLEALAVFVAALALDFSVARQAIAVQTRAAHRAARWSIACACCAAVCIYAYVDNPAMLVVECAGYYTGTWLAVKR